MSEKGEIPDPSLTYNLNPDNAAGMSMGLVFLL